MLNSHSTSIYDCHVIRENGNEERLIDIKPSDIVPRIEITKQSSADIPGVKPSNAKPVASDEFRAYGDKLNLGARQALVPRAAINQAYLARHLVILSEHDQDRFAEEPVEATLHPLTEGSLSATADILSSSRRLP